MFRVRFLIACGGGVSRSFSLCFLVVGTEFDFAVEDVAEGVGDEDETDVEGIGVGRAGEGTNALLL